MPRLSIDALNNVVMVQDPTPIAGKVVIEATTAGIVHRTVTWSQLQRMMPKLIALEAAREIDFYVTDTPSDDPRGVELGLAGLPAISYLTEGSGPIVPGAVATTDHVLTGVNFLAGQSQAQVRLGSATVDNDAILIRAIQPGPGGAEYTVAITDNLGGATTFAAVPLLSNNLVISTDITGPITYATLAAEINALAGVGAYGASGIPLEAEIPGTGAGNVVIEATTALVGGAGPGLTITVGGVTGDITWADILGTTVRFGIDLSASGPAASTSVITAVLRAGKQVTEVDIPMITSAMQFKGVIAAAADFPTTGVVQPGWMYRVTADVTDNDPTKTNTGQSFLAQAEIAWDGATWSELGTETTTTFIVATPAILGQGDALAEVDTATIAGPAVVNLPAATAGRIGKIMTIVDVSGAAGVGAEIAVTPDGTDEINGINAPVNIDIPYGGYIFTCVQTGAATYGWVIEVATEVMINTIRTGNWLAGNVPNETDVNNAAGAYAVLATDVILNMLSATGVTEAVLPAGVATKTYTIKDSDGAAGTNTITITPTGGETIEGAAALLLLHNFDSVTLLYDVTDTDWKVLHRVENSKVQGVNGTIDMAPGAPPVNNILQLDGGAGRAFILKEAYFRVNAGAVNLAGDVTISIGTTPGGAELLAAAPLTGLDTVGGYYRIAFVGPRPAMVGNAALDVTVTIADTGGGAAGTMTGYLKGEEV